MPLPWNRPGDRTAALGPFEYALNDAFEALRIPWPCGFWEADFAALLAFAEGRTTPAGDKLTLTPPLVRAAALSIRAHPEMNRLFRGSRVIQPGSIDIGVSVAVETMRLAPIVVIERADEKSVDAIAEEIRARSAEVRANERKAIDDMNRAARLFPFPLLRRLLMRWFMRRDWVVRPMSGTFQISNYGGVGIEAAVTPVALVPLLGVGKVKRRPFVVGDRIEIRPTSILSVQIDHRNTDGRTLGLFMQTLLGYIAEPDRLLAP